MVLWLIFVIYSCWVITFKDNKMFHVMKHYFPYDNIIALIILKKFQYLWDLGIREVQKLKSRRDLTGHGGVGLIPASLDAEAGGSQVKAQCRQLRMILS